jgi:aminopeptidase N
MIWRMTSLTQDEAFARADQITVSSYEIELDLTELAEGTTLRSRSTIRYHARGAETFLDLAAESVEAWLDGERLPAEAFAGERLRLSAPAGDHLVVVESMTTRTTQRAGIHRVVDPGDGEAYVWTSFEPDDAHRVFACFDQPDLKATFAVTVRAPAEWIVSSNSAPEEIVDGDGHRVWSFAETPRLPAYVVVVTAGPFHEIRRTVEGYDLGLLARRSLAGYLDEQADELFELTSAGLRFFGEQFAMPFPQARYTQVFCPDFQGAMENWGCVTWMDSFVFRTAPTATERELRAIILLHEMAHMWFGDIVTMRWWDDLWLNESFADWAAVWATAEATEFTAAWASFTGLRKEAGYTADRSPATHPIRQQVLSVEAAKAAFDMVTYAKGASVLRQLAAYAGHEQFVAGLRAHFVRHAFANATLADLLSAVGEASDRDLSAWSQEWLLAAGTDTLAVRTTLAGETYASVEVLIEPPAQYPAQRPHRVSLGVYDLHEGAPVLRERIDLDVAGPSTPVPALAGAPTAALLLLNDADLTFARVRPDEAGLAALQQHGPWLPDPVSRAVARLTLWHLVDDGLLPATDVVQYVVRALPAETEAAVREGLLRNAVTAVQDWTSGSAAVVAGRELAQACLDLVARAEREGDPAMRLSALQAALAVAYDRGILAELDDLVGSDPDLRWRWFARSASIGDYDEAAVDRALELDPDPDAPARAIGVRAARPELAAKREAWNAVFVERAVPLQAYVPIGVAFWDAAHADVLGEFADDFLARLPSLDDMGMTATMATVRSFFPRHGIEADFPERARQAVADDRVTAVVKAQVTERAATLERILRARALSDSNAVGTER